MGIDSAADKQGVAKILGPTLTLQICTARFLILYIMPTWLHQVTPREGPSLLNPRVRANERGCELRALADPGNTI